MAFVGFMEIITIAGMVYFGVKWLIAKNSKNKHQFIHKYKSRFWISFVLFIIFIFVGGHISNSEARQASQKKDTPESSKTISTNDINKLNSHKSKSNKISKKQQAINEKRKREDAAKEQAKLNKEYPAIQDQLQNMSNNQLFMTQSKVEGKVLSWGAQNDGSGMILIKDNAGNKFTLEPNHSLKGIEDGSTIVAYGGNFDKQKVNDSQTNNAISSAYLGDNVINMPSIDHIKLLGSKGDI